MNTRDCVIKLKTHTCVGDSGSDKGYYFTNHLGIVLLLLLTKIYFWVN